MQPRRRVIASLLFIGIASACQPAPAALSEKDIADIKAVEARWINAFVTNKKDDLTNIITDDMVMLPVNSPAISGREAAMAYMKGYPTITKFTTTTDEISGEGSVAFVRGTYSIDATLPDGAAIHDQGTYLDVHRKQADGSWPYARLMWHSSEPLPAPAAPPKK